MNLKKILFFFLINLGLNIYSQLEVPKIELRNITKHTILLRFNLSEPIITLNPGSSTKINPEVILQVDAKYKGGLSDYKPLSLEHITTKMGDKENAIVDLVPEGMFKIGVGKVQYVPIISTISLNR